MIIGIGTDIVDIRRIEKVLYKYGEKFKIRCFSHNEISRSEKKYNRVNSYAKRYAAKEACSKALGTGFKAGVFWRNIEVITLASGQPKIKLTGGALLRLEKLTPRGMEAFVHVTQTDEYPLPNAVVIIEARQSGLPLIYDVNDYT